MATKKKKTTKAKKKTKKSPAKKKKTTKKKPKKKPVKKSSKKKAKPKKKAAKKPIKKKPKPKKLQKGPKKTRKPVKKAAKKKAPLKKKATAGKKPAPKKVPAKAAKPRKAEALEDVNFDLDSKVQRQKDVAWRMIEGEAVIITPADSTMHTLNDVGTRIWELITGDRSLRDVAGVLTTEFEVDKDRAEKDTLWFAECLAKKGLVETD